GIVVVGALVANVTGIGYYAMLRPDVRATVDDLATIAFVWRDYVVSIAIVVGVYEALTWGLTWLPLRRRADAAHEPSRRQAFFVFAMSWFGAALWASALAGAMGGSLDNVGLAVIRWGYWGFAVGGPAALVVWWLAHRRNLRFIRHGGHRHDPDQSLPPLVP
ncbi:MAG: hypothetical protein HYR75_10480, partial [Gemmatimonadetes bacterium]|nr:hypothetical protein [Gemmatimonadota bacterium]